MQLKRGFSGGNVLVYNYRIFIFIIANGYGVENSEAKRGRLEHMVDAFIYMVVVAAGATTGVAIVGLITWRIVMRILNKGSKKVRKRGIV